MPFNTALLGLVAAGAPAVLADDAQTAHLTFRAASSPETYDLAVRADGGSVETGHADLAVHLIDAPDYLAYSLCKFATPQPVELSTTIADDNVTQQVVLDPPQPVLSVTCEGMTASTPERITPCRALPGCFWPMKPSTSAAPSAAVATLAPLAPSHGLGSLRLFMAACAPAVKAVRAPAWTSGLAHSAAPRFIKAAGIELRRAGFAAADAPAPAPAAAGAAAARPRVVGGGGEGAAGTPRAVDGLPWERGRRRAS
ncbi:galactose-proton symport [Purpureocillium lavendulum]|uniref:Galactose-proton symport n=1 Tax=Purpureocillium lavendulum TaxID=1247861 RepID=A0AB34FTU8_9HYPO|nr:galactose-proton symport [Purpureocillium lavendulum]